MWKKSGLCQNNCLGIKWLSSLHCREVRSVITFSFDSRRNGPEDLKYLKFHQQTADLVGTTGTVRIVKRNSERVKVKGIGCQVLSDSLWPYGPSPARLLCPWDSLGENTGVGCHVPPAGDLPDPGIEPGSPTLPTVSLPFEPLGKPTERVSK